MRFNQPLQGRGPRSPNPGKVVLGCLIGVGVSVSYSQLFYKPLALNSGQGVSAVGTVVPIPHTECQLTIKPESAMRVVVQLEQIPETAPAADLCRRILRAQAMTAAACQKGEPK
jgi:hypothetical protein